MDTEISQKVLHMFDSNIMMRSVEYFSNENWLKLPNCWKLFLENCSLDVVIDYVNLNHVPTAVMPLSMIALQSTIRNLVYSRKMIQSTEELEKRWKGADSSNGTNSKFRVISSDGIIRKRIKIKKQHEIDRIVELVRQLQENNDGIDSLVDIGAGVGHLSRIIAMYNKLSVMAVEGNEQFTISANSLDEKISSKNIGLTSETSPLRFTSFVTEELSEKIDEFSTSGAILVGLHTCGDFSSTILKVFQRSKKAKCLILIGCCYHKEYQCFSFLNPGVEVQGTCPSGVFPLSKKWNGVSLNYVMREMACHNNENLEEIHSKNNITRYARAHLEKIICSITENEEDRNIGMCPVKCDDEIKFGEYIQKAMTKRGSHLIQKVMKATPSEILETPVAQLPQENFDKTDTIRLIFAQLIESCIIDDRLEYLRENGYKCQVVPLFDPKLSPRNLAIVCNKV